MTLGKLATVSPTYCTSYSKLQQLNLDPSIITWVSNYMYLSDRSQCVAVDGAASEYLPVISGIPQGPVLGPLLFLIYINNLDISEGSKIMLYADDILLYWPVSSNGDFAALQSDVNMIQNWASSNFMTFNKTKCKVMHISPHCPLVHPQCLMAPFLRWPPHTSIWDFSFHQI